MKWWKFLFWNAFGGIVWATLVGLLAYYAGHAVTDAIERYGLFAALGLIAAFLIGWLVLRFGERWLEQRGER
jgi:membrane protein DedA with SNARE-associated domain